MLANAGVLPERFGRYQVLQALGQGSIGYIFEVQDTEAFRRVALKVPINKPKHTAAMRQRDNAFFKREAQVYSQIYHPNLCPVLELGEAGGVPYVTMPLVDGTPLAQRLQSAPPWPPREAVEFIKKVALTVQVLHDSGLVHRDIKPATILERYGHEPLLLDYSMLEGGNGSTTTLSGNKQNSAYLSPESLLGVPQNVGPASDIYNLGAVLYHLLTGRMPFQDMPGLIFDHIRHTEPASAAMIRSGLDPVLSTICQKAMRKKPEERYLNIAAFLEALDEFLERDQSPRGLLDPASSREHEAKLKSVLTQVEEEKQARRAAEDQRDQALGQIRPLRERLEKALEAEKSLRAIEAQLQLEADSYAAREQKAVRQVQQERDQILAEMTQLRVQLEETQGLRNRVQELEAQLAVENQEKEKAVERMVNRPTEELLAIHEHDVRRRNAEEQLTALRDAKTAVEVERDKAIEELDQAKELIQEYAIRLEREQFLRETAAVPAVPETELQSKLRAAEELLVKAQQGQENTEAECDRLTAELQALRAERAEAAPAADGAMIVTMSEDTSEWIAALQEAEQEKERLAGEVNRLRDMEAMFEKIDQARLAAEAERDRLATETERFRAQGQAGAAAEIKLAQLQQALAQEQEARLALEGKHRKLMVLYDQVADKVRKQDAQPAPPPAKAPPVERPSIPAAATAGPIEIAVAGTFYARPADQPQAEWVQVAETPATVMDQPGLVYWLTLDGRINNGELAGLAKFKGLPTLQQLMFWYCGRVTDDGLEHLKALPHLQQLMFWSCGRITDAAVAHLVHLKELQQLMFMNCGRISGKCFEHLIPLKKLRTLALKQAGPVTDDDLARLGQVTSLQVLDLGDCSKVTDFGLVYLHKLTGLQKLHLGGNPTISEAATEALCRAAPDCVISR